MCKGLLLQELSDYPQHRHCTSAPDSPSLLFQFWSLEFVWSKELCGRCTKLKKLHTASVFLKSASFVSFTDKNFKCLTEIKILSVQMSQSNLPSPRNSDCAGIPAGLHGVPQLFLYPHVENAQEVPNGSKQMYSCAQTKINSREPSWMVWKYSSMQTMHIPLIFMQFSWPEVENKQCHWHRYDMLN